MRSPLALAAALACGLALLLVRPAPAGADVEVTVHQFNMQPEQGDAADYDATVDTVTFLTGLTPRPYAIALNEVCYGQYLEIRDVLQARGYATTTITWVSLITSTPFCGGERYGNAVFLRGATPSHEYVYHGQGAGDGYTRKGICNQVVTFLGDFVACADHFTLDQAVSPTQADELRVTASFLYPGKLKWLMGDFNLRPPWPPSCRAVVPWDNYVHYYEADQDDNASTRDIANTCNPPHHVPSWVKNDYIFGAKNVFSSSVVGTPSDVSTSDHHYYVGEFTIPL